MMAEKGRLFSIGQFAALHGVNKKTLMWYDEIGLFCPAVVKENGYRYYTYFQSATLEAILLLRELDVPVARIRSFLDDRSAQSLAALWDEQLDAVDRKLARLRELRRERGITQLKLGMDLNMSQNTISRYETGAHEAGYAELCRIAEYFGVTVDYLLERTDRRN